VDNGQYSAKLHKNLR